MDTMRLGKLWMVLLILWTVQACKSNKQESKLKTDSINAIKDTTPRQGIAVEKTDAEFAVEAVSGGITEVELGKLARLKGQNRRIKNFGAMMVKDHSKINNEIESLAGTKNIAIPVKPDIDEQNTIAELAKKSGADFDKAFITDMIADHKNDIQAFEKASKHCIDPDIKDFAAKTLPILHAHLDAVSAVYDSMK